MKTAELTNEQKLSIALKAMHETMLQNPIGYSAVMSILKEHHVKNVSPIAIFLKKDHIIKYTGKPGRGATYCWNDGVNSNLPLAKRINEKAQKYLDHCNDISVQRRVAKIQSSHGGTIPFPVVPNVKQPTSELESMQKHLDRLEKQLMEMNKQKPVPVAKPRKKIKFQSPIKVSFGIKLRKMIYFV